MNKKLIAGLAVFAAVVLGCGSGAEVASGGGDAAEPVIEQGHEPVTVALGQKITVDDGGLKATYRLSKPEIRKSDAYGIRPQNGVWLLAFLRVDVTAGEAFPCGCDLALVEKDGKVNELGAGGLQNRPDFTPTQLKAGQHAEGWVVFDLPEGAVKGSRVQLKVTQLFTDSAYGYWTVKV